MPWKGFENKSHQRRAHHLKPRRNGRSIPTGGLEDPPSPILARLNPILQGGVQCARTRR